MAKYCGSSYLQKQFVAEQKIHTKPVTINMPNLRIQYFPIKNILRSIIAQYPWLIESIQKEKERNEYFEVHTGFYCLCCSFLVSSSSSSSFIQFLFLFLFDNNDDDHHLNQKEIERAMSVLVCTFINICMSIPFTFH